MGASYSKFTKGDAEAALKKAGFEMVRHKGGHEVWKHESGRSVPIPHGPARKHLSGNVISHVRSALREATGTDQDLRGLLDNDVALLLAGLGLLAIIGILKRRGF